MIEKSVTVLWQAPGLVAAYKEAGLATAPDRSGADNLMERLRAQLSAEAGAPVSLYLLHRLDCPVSGVVLFARDRAHAAEYSRRFATHDGMEKTYFAVSAAPLAQEGQLCDLLFHDTRAGKAFVVKSARTGVKEARLEAFLLAVRHTSSGARFLYRITLFTGRFHQIRAQFASRGAPLCGDGKYGSRVGGALALCAARLTFPYAGERRTVAAPVPPGLPWSLFSDVADIAPAAEDLG